jgi:hypothetical protein
MQRLIILLALGLALAACKSNPDDPDGTNNSTPGTVTMTQFPDLPIAGGDVTGIAIAPDNRVIASVDGKIYSASLSGGMMQLINGDPGNMSIGLAPSGELYSVTPTEIRTFDLAAGTYRSVPIDPAGPLAINRRVEISEIIFSPDGIPYIRMINNTPQLYVYYSTDKGMSWKSLKLPDGIRYGAGMAFAPNGDIVISGVYNIYRSSDNGATWTTNPPPIANYGPDVLVTSNGDIYCYVVGGGGLAVSRNGGTSFTQLTAVNRSPFFISIREGSDHALYALANTTSSGVSTDVRATSLLRSTDGGVTWKHFYFAQGRILAMRGSQMAVGLVASSAGTEQRYGGILTSTDLGATWVSSGTRPVQNVGDIAFDRDGKVMILADRALFRKASSGWQVIAEQSTAFDRMATTPQGAIAIANTSEVFYSSDNGATWSDSLVRDYTQGIDPPSVTVLLGKKDGEFLMAITSYSDNRGYTNGHLYRIGSSGAPVRVTNLPYSFEAIVEDRNGKLYGGSETTNSFTGQFIPQGYMSTDGGSTWTEQTGKDIVKVGRAFNSANNYFSIDGNDAYSLGTIGSDQKKQLKLEGFPETGNLIKRVAFGRDDKLYLTSYEGALFVSSAPVR